jgi:hypothetical protein
VAQLPDRGPGHGGLGSSYLHFQQHRRNRLRLPQRKTHTASLLDVLGPWPVYLLTAATLILIVWAMMTWPWERIRRHAKEGP